LNRSSTVGDGDEFVSVGAPRRLHRASRADRLLRVRRVFESARDDLIVVPEISLGPSVGRNLVVARTREGGPERCLLGMDVLKEHSLHFHFSESRVTLEAPEDSTASMERHELDLDSGFIPHVDVGCGETVCKAVWDRELA